jgi:hypothetical protein
MAELSIDESIINDIDIDNIIESLDNSENNINSFTKNLEKELENFDNHEINNSKSNIEIINISKNNLITYIGKDVFIYTIIFIIINLIFINKNENKYLYFIIKTMFFILILLSIKKYQLFDI